MMNCNSHLSGERFELLQTDDFSRGFVENNTSSKHTHWGQLLLFLHLTRGKKKLCCHCQFGRWWYII